MTVEKRREGLQRTAANYWAMADRYSDLAEEYRRKAEAKEREAMAL